MVLCDTVNVYLVASDQMRIPVVKPSVGVLSVPSARSTLFWPIVLSVNTLPFT